MVQHFVKIAQAVIVGVGACVSRVAGIESVLNLDIVIDTVRIGIAQGRIGRRR